MHTEIGDELWVEDKAYSLTVHYRQASDPSAVEQTLMTTLSALLPSPRLIAGQFNVSLLPPNAGDKGRAVQKLLELSHGYRALYVGDDQTDEDVFALHHPAIFSVRVGDEARSDASYGITGHAEIVRFLDLLLALLPARATDQSLFFGVHRQ